MGKTKKIKAIHNTDCLCWKCLKKHDKDKIHIIEIEALGYNSRFDNLSTRIQLCDDCYNANPEWWKLERMKPKGFEEFGSVYKYEKEIYQFIDALPLQSQQFVWNEYAYGANATYHMDAQDWIDYQLGILPHKKCREYGMFSPDEKQAYKDRFPTCQHPVVIIYNDGSDGSHCPFGSSGEYKDGSVITDINIYTACYKCRYYKKRTTPVLKIRCKDESDYKLYLKYQLNKERLEKKFIDLKGVI